MIIMRMLRVLVMAGIMCVFALPAQAKSAKWKHMGTSTQPNYSLFHSTQALALPTAETLRQGIIQFEIQHRFVPAVSSGLGGLYGVDGPAYIRFGLAYGFTHDLTLTLGRSNLDDNYDLQAKQVIYQNRLGEWPLVMAVQLGSAWNASVAGRSSLDQRNFQNYGQLIVNMMPLEQWAFGLVPTFVDNASYNTAQTQSTLALGTYIQYYVTDLWSLVAEWNHLISGYINSYPSASYGFELETGGHFFKFFVSNTAKINQAQYVTGGDLNGDWRLGFLITRLLKF